MLGKLLSFLAVTISVLTVAAASNDDRWTVYPTVSDGFTTVVETPRCVYALSGSTLVRRGLDDNEFYVYDASRLSDSGPVSHIRYNYDGGYLLVVYGDGNMDLVYEGDRIVNLPEIRDAVVSGSRKVNGSSFHDGRIYLATDFGLVVYDDKRHEVIESGIYNRSLTHAFVMNGRLLVRTADYEGPYNLYSAPLEGRHSEWNVFRRLDALDFGAGDSEVVVLADGSLLHNHGINGIMRHRYDNWEPSDVFFPASTVAPGTLCDIHPVRDGAVFHYGDRAVFTDGTTTEVIALPGSADKVFAPARSAKSVWLAAEGGASRYDLSGAQPSLLMTLLPPEGFTAAEPCQMVYAPSGNLYVGNISANFSFANPGDNFDQACYLDRMDGSGKITDVAPRCDAGTGLDSYNVTTGRINAAMQFVEDPDDSSLYYIASNRYGLLAVRDKRIVKIFNSENSYTPAGMARTLSTAVDNDGNLWMGNGYRLNLGKASTLQVLPAAKRRNLESVTKADWIPVPDMFDANNIYSRDARMLFLRKMPGYSLFFPGGWGGALYVRYDNGTPLDFSDDRVVGFGSLTDRESNVLSPYFYHSMVEDASGRVWLGTNSGVYVIDDIRNAFGADFRVRRPIVARNDGTPYGDYLLDQESVLAIAVDPSDRKWLATSGAGAFLVSSDGTKIIENYTAANSPLPSDVVEAVAANPASNRVFIGTAAGVVRLESDSSPAASDYSDIYVYPNPVRPEYGGPITIAGLMENTLVKIADSAGNVLFQGRSEGGMATWNGCGPDGQRVRSGVYFVFASQNGDGGSSGAVAKFMIVN